MAGFEEDEAYGEGGAALLLETGDEDTLGIAQAEEDVGAGVLIMDPYEGCGPEGKIVAISEADEFLGDLVAVGFLGGDSEDIGQEFHDGAGFNEAGDEGDLHHFGGDPLDGEGEIGDGNANALPYGAFARDGIEPGIDCFVAGVVLLDET